MEPVNVNKNYSEVYPFASYEVVVHPEIVQVDKLPLYWLMDKKTQKAMDAAAGPHLSIDWPECCALCLGEVAGYRKVSGEGSDRCWGGWEDDYSVSTMRLDVQVPYCAECKKKVGRLFRSEKEAVSIALTVRVVDFFGNLQLHGVRIACRNPEYAKRLVLANASIASDVHLREPEKKAARKKKATRKKAT